MVIAEADQKKLRKIANALVDKAIDGDVGAIREFADRIEGRPIQQLEVGSPGDFDEKSDADLFAELLREAEELGVPLGETSH
jgi:hypothetical protein